MMTALFILSICIIILLFVVISLKLKETSYQMRLHTEIMENLNSHKEVFVNHVEAKEEEMKLKQTIVNKVSILEESMASVLSMTEDMWKKEFLPATVELEHQAAQKFVEEVAELPTVQVEDEETTDEQNQ